MLTKKTKKRIKIENKCNNDSISNNNNNSINNNNNDESIIFDEFGYIIRNDERGTMIIISTSKIIMITRKIIMIVIMIYIYIYIYIIIYTTPSTGSIILNIIIIPGK